MPFHRLLVPTYFGGLPSGYDYVNDPVANGDSGVPAQAEPKKTGGPNDGTYFVAFQEPGTSAITNRGLMALAENTDQLDDYLRRDLATPTVSVAATPGAPLASVVVPGTVFVGALGATNDQRTRSGLVAVLDGDGLPLHVLSGSVYAPVLAQLIHDGLSNNVVGVTASEFFTNPTVTFTTPIPAGQSYRLSYASRGNLATQSTQVLSRLAQGVRGGEDLWAYVKTTRSGAATFTGNKIFNSLVTFNDPVTFNDTVVFNDPVTLSDTTTLAGETLVPGYFSGVIPFNGPSPTLRFTETDAAPDKRVWDLALDSGILSLHAKTDALAIAAAFLTLTREAPLPGGNVLPILEVGTQTIFTADVIAGSTYRGRVEWMLKTFMPPITISTSSFDPTLSKVPADAIAPGNAEFLVSVTSGPHSLLYSYDGFLGYPEGSDSGVAPTAVVVKTWWDSLHSKFVGIDHANNRLTYTPDPRSVAWANGPAIAGNINSSFSALGSHWDPVQSKGVLITDTPYDIYRFSDPTVAPVAATTLPSGMPAEQPRAVTSNTQGTWVLVYGSVTPRFAYSTNDGDTWTETTATPAIAGLLVQNVFWTNSWYDQPGRFYALLHSTAGTQPWKLWSSADGITWIDQSYKLPRPQRDPGISPAVPRRVYTAVDHLGTHSIAMFGDMQPSGLSYVMTTDGGESFSNARFNYTGTFSGVTGLVTFGDRLVFGWDNASAHHQIYMSFGGR